MKLFFHYCLPGFTNCYILGSDVDGGAEGDASGRRDALIIDPGIMDAEILNIIEGHDYTLQGVLITHDHGKHVQGLRTLKKIYNNAAVYAVNHHIQDIQTVIVRDRDSIAAGSFQVEVIAIPGHSSDSAVYQIENLLFTGDALSAGLIGRTASSYGAAVQMTALRSKILSQPGDFTIILPGHGPPSSLKAERRFNAGIQRYEERSSRRPRFPIDFFE